MAFFKTEEERKAEKERKLKEAEERILNTKRYEGKVGQIHQGLSTFGLWGVRDNGKAKFNSTTFEIHDDKLLIQRNRLIIQFQDIKEIFQEKNYEAIIILNNGDGVSIQGGRTGDIGLKAFVNVLNKLTKDYKSNLKNINSNADNSIKTEDKIDKLIKLGEMHDKGLLSNEEFASLKQELLSGNNEDTTNPDEYNDETSEDNIEISENTCENCGSDISPDDVFCSECGTQINDN